MSTGLAFPEFQVAGLVEGVLTALADADAGLLEELVRALPPEKAASIRKALETREGKVQLGWSAEAPSDWCIAVTLGGTAKGGKGGGTLGDIVSRPYEVGLTGRQLAAAITADEGVAVTFTNPMPSVPGEVQARGLVRLRDDELREYATYEINAGVCRLTHRGILPETGTVARAWDVGTEVLFFEWEQNEGWPEDLTLRLDVGGINPTFVMAIGRIVQAFIAREAGAFHAAGYALHECNATDLAPRPPHWPAPWFNRTLSVRFSSVLALPRAFPGLVDTVTTLTAEAA